MSTGKRLAKRSIIGTRVCAPGEDGKYYSGGIIAVKTPENFAESSNSNCINLTPNTRYSVRFDPRQGNLGRTTAEFFEVDLIGPGFRSVAGIELVRGQKCFVTYKGREVCGEVQSHQVDADEVVISINPQGCELLQPIQVYKRLEDVRLLESRKSARLADQDTDFARLADMAGDRKRTATSHTIDVPQPTYSYVSRKRRPSSSQDEFTTKDPQMDECSAALVLMSLSCSPHSPNFSNMSLAGTSPTSSSSGSSWRLSPSPPPRETSSPTIHLSSSCASDEGIGLDYPDELPRKKKVRSLHSPYYTDLSSPYEKPDPIQSSDNSQTTIRIVYMCTWPGCRTEVTNNCETMEAHVRNDHLIKRGDQITDGEEEFYYTEIEYGQTSPPPTLSHRDMARPPHEDPEYQRQLVGTLRQQFLSGPINIPQSPHKLLKLSGVASVAPIAYRPHSPKMPVSPRRARGENKKCRKVYGMEHRELWCTQCKWKKACTRFGDAAGY